MWKSKQSIKRQEFMHLQLYRNSQEQFSVKGIPSNFEKTEKFPLITWYLKEKKTLGQIHFLMHISNPSEAVFLPALSFCQHYLVHREHSGPCIFLAGAEKFPHPQKQSCTIQNLQGHLKTAHLIATNVTGNSLHWNSVRKPWNSRKVGLLRATQFTILTCYCTKSLPMELQQTGKEQLWPMCWWTCHLKSPFFFFLTNKQNRTSQDLHEISHHTHWHMN